MSDFRLIALVTRRELMERLRLRSFRIFTVIIFVLTAGGIVGLNSAPEIFGNSDATIGIVSPVASGDLEPALQDAADLQDIDLSTQTFTDRESAEAALDDGDVDAILDGQELLFDEEEDSDLAAVVNLGLYQARLPQLLNDLGLTEQEARPLLNPSPADVTVLNPERSQEDLENRRLLSFIATIALYGILVMYGNWILTGVIEEKSSRVVEVLLGLVRAQDLLAGKTIGILLVALLQLAAGVLGAAAGLALIGTTDILPPVTLDVALSGGIYLIAGVVLYSLVFAVVGSTVSRQSEAQSAAAPITMLLLVPYLISLSYIPQEPDSMLSRVLSLVPFTSPLTMPTRVALGSPSIIELAAGVILLLATIAVVAWLGGKAYAGAILSGRRVTWSQLFQTVRSEG